MPEYKRKIKWEEEETERKNHTKGNNKQNERTQGKRKKEREK